MLTAAQYKALKAWPDGQAVYITSKGGFSVTKLGWLVCGIYIFCGLLKRGLVWTNTAGAAVKLQPACDEAIREYEEAQERRSKA